MKYNLRPFIITTITSVIIFSVPLQFFDLGHGSALIVSHCFLYAILGILVGTKWSVYPWQIGIFASLPSWIYLGWRLIFRDQDPNDIALNISFFYFHPMLSMISSYVGTYFGRWLAFRQKKSSVAEADRKDQA